MAEILPIRHTTLYNQSIFMLTIVLSHIFLTGCSGIRYYGSTCSLPCPPDCKEKRCNVDTGHCLSCDSGFYGRDCKNTCPKNCKNNNCDINTGHCIACEAGHYGNNCTVPCSKNCRDMKCRLNTGDCLNCTAGYEGQTCDNGTFLTHAF